MISLVEKPEDKASGQKRWTFLLAILPTTKMRNVQTFHNSDGTVCWSKTRIGSIVDDLTSSEQGAYPTAVGLAIQKSHVNNKWEAVFPCFSPHTKNRQN